jgi:hypothetical protein
MTDLEIQILEFYREEASSYDVIVVRRLYVDMAGNLNAAALLSRVAWHLAKRTSAVVEMDECDWVALARPEWWRECRLKPNQYDYACTQLEKRKLIETRAAQVPGYDSPIRHITIRWEQFFSVRKQALDKDPDLQRRRAKARKKSSENSEVEF